MANYVDGIRFVTIGCYKCSVPFGITDDLNNRCLSDHNRSFYCPNGHSQAYIGKTKEQKLRDQLRKKEQDVLDEHNNVIRLKNKLDKASRKYQKTRERIKNGVCPCCTRSFTNLYNHMKSKHPEYGDQKYLKNIRETYGLTQADLAEEIGIQTVYISLYEREKPMPSYAKDEINNWLSESA